MTDLGRILARFSLLLAALAFAAGIVHSRYGPVPHSLSAWSLALLGAALLLLLLARFRHPLTGPITVLLLFFLAGNIHLGNTSDSDRPTALDHFLDTGDSLTLSGRLKTAPSYNGLRSKLLFQADQLWLPQGTITPIAEQILLTMPFAVPDHLEAGQRLLVRATLSRPQPPGTPGSFDYHQYLADRDIHITGYLRSPACLTALHLSSGGKDWTTTLRYWPQKARQKVNRFIAEAPLPPPAIGLYQALVTGELALVPPKTLAAFRTSGAFHLLSISGTHLALLGLLCGLTLNLLLHRSRRLLLNCSVGKITAALTILVLLLYSLLAGMNPPVVRSLIMAICLIGGLLINRSHFLPNSLGLALLLSLLWRPADLFHASFQLSYAAITGIVILHAAVGNRFRADAEAGPTKRFSHWLLAGLAVSLAALLATAPITQYNFRQVALLSPLSTMLLAPMLCFWSLPLGLLASLLSSWFPTAATSLLELGSLGLALADWLNTWLTGLSSHTWQPPIMPLAAIPFYYLGLAALLLSRNSLPARTISAASLTVLLVMMLTPPMASSNNGETRVTFLDVGQGSATLLELPGDRNILIDGGSSGSEDYDVGAEVIAPFLHHLGIRSLETVVITHDHADHYNGLATVIDRFPPAIVWTNDNTARSPGLAALLAKAGQRGATVKVPAPDEDILATPDNLLTCLSRHHQLAYAELPENRRSLVLRLNSRGRIFLLPGDILAEDGQELRDDGVSLGCEVLLAPHHGSDNSASLVLGEAGRPKLLVVSAGGYGEGNFPGAKVKEWCCVNGVAIHRTGTKGTISFTIGPEGGLSWRRLSAKGGDQALPYQNK